MSQMKNQLIFNRFLACGQLAPENQNQTPYRSPLALLADFSFCRITHLGACSQLIGFRTTGPSQNIMGNLPEGLFNLEPQQLEAIQRGGPNGRGDHFES